MLYTKNNSFSAFSPYRLLCLSMKTCPAELTSCRIWWLFQINSIGVWMTFLQVIFQFVYCLQFWLNTSEWQHLLTLRFTSVRLWLLKIVPNNVSRHCFFFQNDNSRYNTVSYSTFPQALYIQHGIAFTGQWQHVFCFSKIQVCFTFLVTAHPGSPGQRAVKRVCVCVLLILHHY